MSDITISYKGSSIATMDATGTKTLLTEGKYCEDDIEVAYTKPSGGSFDWDAFLAGTAPSSDSVNLTYTGDISQYKFAYLTAIKSISAPNIVVIDNNAFNTCSNLEELTDLDNVTTLGQYAFSKCSKLGWLYLPKCTTIKTGSYAFYNAGKSGYGIVMPALSGTTPPDFFRSTYYTVCDLGEGVTALGTRCFYDSTKTYTIILRNKDNAVSAADTTRLGMKNDSVVYVPEDLVSTYQNATSWSTKYAAGVQFLAIEGSYYETHYADGTLIPSS